MALCGGSLRGLGPSPPEDCGQLWPSPRRPRPLHSPGWKLGWVAQVRSSLLLQACCSCAPHPRMLSLTGSDAQDPREELRIPNPSLFPARLACTSKLKKQFPSAPLTGAQPRGTTDFSSELAWLSFPAAPVPGAPRATPSSHPRCLRPSVRARPRGTRGP